MQMEDVYCTQPGYGILATTPSRWFYPTNRNGSTRLFHTSNVRWVARFARLTLIEKKVSP